jgi:hypothetical protein
MYKSLHPDVADSNGSFNHFDASGPFLLDETTEDQSEHDP